MADEADCADEVIQQMLANPMNPFEGMPKLKPCGVCHNQLCMESLEKPEQLFCDKKCADEWSAHEQGRLRGR